MSTRNRYTTEERVALAQHMTNKLNGVQAVQQRHALPDSSAFIAENPDRYEVLPNNYDGFPVDSLMVIPYG